MEWRGERNGLGPMVPGVGSGDLGLKAVRIPKLALSLPRSNWVTRGKSLTLGDLPISYLSSGDNMHLLGPGGPGLCENMEMKVPCKQ